MYYTIIIGSFDQTLKFEPVAICYFGHTFVLDVYVFYFFLMLINIIYIYTSMVYMVM